MALDAGSTFGNGREVRNLLGEMMNNQANRLTQSGRIYSQTDPELFTLKVDDLQV